MSNGGLTIIVKAIMTFVLALMLLCIVAFAMIAPKVINEALDIYRLSMTLLVEQVEKGGER